VTILVEFLAVNQVLIHSKKKSKAIPLKGRGGLHGCEMLGIPYCLDNWLTDGSKVVSPMHWSHSTPQKHYFSTSGTHFCKPKSLARLEGFDKVKTLIHFSG
jgi:hypothetical protein